MTSVRVSVFAALLVFFTLCGRPAAEASGDPTLPPAENDTFAERQFLGAGLRLSSLPVSYETATADVSDPHFNPDSVTVWFSWQAPADGQLKVHSGASATGIFTGSAVNALQEVAWTVLDNKQTASWVTKATVQSGRVYHLLLQMPEDYLTSYLTIEWSPPAPANIDAAHATDFGSAAVVNAQLQPVPGVSPEVERWYSWTASSSETVVVASNASNDDGFSSQLLAVIDAETGTAVHSSNGPPMEWMPAEYRVDLEGLMGFYFRPVPGRRYLIHLGAAAERLAIFSKGTPPANDEPATATDLGVQFPVRVDADIAAATVSESPAFSGDATGDVWYRWTPVTTRYIGVVASEGTSVFHQVAGGSLNSLTVDNFRCLVIAGQRYLFRLQRYQYRQTGTLALEEATVPANDNFANAQVIAGAPATVAGDLRYATLETDELLPSQHATRHTVWCRWNPTRGVYSLGLSATHAGVEFYRQAGNTLEREFYPNIIREEGVRYIQIYLVPVGNDVQTQWSLTITGRATGTLPPNDDWSAAVNLGSAASVIATGTAFMGGLQEGDPFLNSIQFAGAVSSVWYRWRAPQTGWYHLACGGPIHTRSVFELSGVPVPFGGPFYDDGGPHFYAPAGLTLLFGVVGQADDEGTFTLAVAPVTRPVNDDFSGATDLPSTDQWSANGTLNKSTVQAGELVFGTTFLARSANFRTVWFRWTPPVTGHYRFTPEGTNFDLDVYTVESGQFVWRGGGSSNAWSVNVTQPNVTHYLRLLQAGYIDPGGGGSFTLAARRITFEPNSYSDMPRDLGHGPSAEVIQQVGMPFDGNVYYAWTAPADAEATVSTGPFAVTIGALVPDPQNPGVFINTRLMTRAGTTRFVTVAGRRYHFTVEVFPEATVQLSIATGALPPAPGNDSHAAFTDLGTAAIQEWETTTYRANVDPEERAMFFGGTQPWWTVGTVWFRWTAPQSGELSFTHAANRWVQFSTEEGVLIGPVSNNVNSWIAAPGSSGSGVVPVVAGAKYWIGVHGPSQVTWEESMPVQFNGIDVPPPENAVNDGMESAVVLTGAGFRTIGTLHSAGSSPGEPRYVAVEPPVASVWYRWTAPSTGRVRLDTRASEYVWVDTQIGVFVSGPDGWREVAFNDDWEFPYGLQPEYGPVKDWRSEVIFDTVAGTEYWIRVSGGQQVEPWDYAATKVFTLTLSPVTRPPNDDIASAIDLGSGPQRAIRGTTFGAGRELSEPLVPGYVTTDEMRGDQFRSVWYRWTAPQTEIVTIFLNRRPVGYGPPNDFVNYWNSGTDGSVRFNPYGHQVDVFDTSFMGMVPAYGGGFTAEAGRTYLLRIRPGADTAEGAFSMTIVEGIAPQSPELVSFQWMDSPVDVTWQERAVTALAHIRAPMGLDRVTLRVRRDSLSLNSIALYSAIPPRHSGDEAEGLYVLTFRLSPDAPAGTWPLNLALDGSNGSWSGWGEDMADFYGPEASRPMPEGSAGTLTVVRGERNFDPHPRLAGVSLVNAAPVDADGPSPYAVFDLTIENDLADDLREARVWLTPQIEVTIGRAHRISGDARRGVYRVSVPVPRIAGSWRPCVSLESSAGFADAWVPDDTAAGLVRARRLIRGIMDLLALNPEGTARPTAQLVPDGPAVTVVRSAGDQVAPIFSGGLAPRHLNAGDQQSVAVEFNATETDGVSGMVELYRSEFTGAERIMARAPFGAAQLLSINDGIGRYRVNVAIAPTALWGSHQWRLTGTDAAGNPAVDRSAWQVLTIINQGVVDDLPPVISLLQFDRTACELNDKMKLSLTVSDDVSGVADVEITLLDSAGQTVWQAQADGGGSDVINWPQLSGLVFCRPGEHLVPGPCHVVVRVTDMAGHESTWQPGENWAHTGSIQESVTLTDGCPTGWLAWLGTHPSLRGAARADIADPENDGWDNLSELVFGLDPLKLSHAGGDDPAFARAPVSGFTGGTIWMQATPVPLPADITLHGQSSANLTAWTNVPLQDAGKGSVRIPAPLSASGRTFLRLQPVRVLEPKVLE